MLQLLTGPKDWQTYQVTLESQCSVQTGLLAWSDAPKDYPCLADCILVGNRPRCCFLYPADAAVLIQATTRQHQAGQAAIDNQRQQIQKFTAEVQYVEDKPRPETPFDAESPLASQDDHNRSVAALCATIANVLIEAQIITPQVFERKLHGVLRLIDERLTQIKDATGIDKESSITTEKIFRQLGFRSGPKQ